MYFYYVDFENEILNQDNMSNDKQKAIDQINIYCNSVHPHLNREADQEL